MDVFTTEEQQLEVIKKWWRTNGSSVLIGAALGLAAIAGWKYYQQNELNKAVNASDAYEAVIKLADDAGKRSEFKQQAEALVSEHQGTAYAQFGQLYLAREAVRDNDLARAASLLQAVVNKPEHEAIGHVATLRLARVKLAQGESDAALKLVDISKEKAGAYAGAYALVRGDVLTALNRTAEANAAYQDAAAEQSVAAQDPALAMKLDASALPALATETAK
ncbi:tetratricopeptide repeat protein [Permianibacter sp. IMCC34836]|uniref:YfgM family protein n=1 Tax=Permianibacter fluminis TaxID=2738515 RepID=UPI0015557570|nr:tetratricopeptide repeat protein [Permianibacter fluminis]NQD38636.1 tetratricopeptide repeat protein [Permianibacter fluminis]